jgi:hypothetical protein
MFSYEVKTADIRDGNEYKIRKWLVLKFHGSEWLCEGGGHGSEAAVSGKLV